MIQEIINLIEGKDNVNKPKKESMNEGQLMIMGLLFLVLIVLILKR